MTMKPWREVIVPHRDVLEGTFQQAEFAADITAVRKGKALPEYQDAKSFFDRTFITEGMRLLLTQVIQRLAGRGGEPVVQLQTAFGGGKTHTLLAVYHLATRGVPLAELSGVSDLVDKASLMDLPHARVAVLDGNEHAPGQPWKHGKQQVRTVWGELAWQLGGSDGFALVQESDASGTSPGKEVLQRLLSSAAPCVVLIDEFAAYLRQFGEGQLLSGGSYDSNLSFVQALTEAVKQVPNAIVLASLPESDVEAGSQRGAAALRALEKTFGRVQALWKPVATEEAFEIVRRRLFGSVRDMKARETICRAFADMYVAEGAKLPSETQEGRYLERLVQAYPIHPEVFDRLYEDWTTIEGFQRTRGVLKLMAKVIYRLWKDENKDLLIMPGSLPLQDGTTRNELMYYLPPGWDPVIERDIDGDRAETTELESREPRFGQVNAARRVARTLFLGTAPASTSTKVSIRGLDRGRVLLGCLQPGQVSSLYSDALNRLADRLHYLNSSGDTAQDSTRFWFDTRANLRREMEDRKRRFDDKTEVRHKIEQSLKDVERTVILFGGVHTFTPHGDVPDDSVLRLVILPPEKWYARDEPSIAREAVLETMRNNGSKPRLRWNRLLFLAADNGLLSRLFDVTRTALAWKSIVDDIHEKRLIADQLRDDQAKKELRSAEDVIPRAVRECYRWLLCPSQDSATSTDAHVEAFPINTSSPSTSREVERICGENELVIENWSPIHLRTKLRDLYWTEGQPATRAMTFWEDSLRYLYLPRFKDREVLAKAIRTGAASQDFFGIAYGKFEGRYDGFQFGSDSAQMDDTLMLIEPEVAREYAERQKAPVIVQPDSAPPTGGTLGATSVGTAFASIGGGEPAKESRSRSVHLSAEISPASAKMRLAELADEIITQLVSDPNAEVKVVLEISAEFGTGVSDQVKRAVNENARSLSLKAPDWE
jgi:hypothetical protein